MENNEINPVVAGGKKGGGLLGAVIGGLAGLGAAAAAPFTGGTSMAALPAILGATAAAAPIAGALLSPAKSGDAGNPIPSINQEGPSNKMSSMQGAPEVQMATMQNAKNLLSTSNIPNAMDYMNHIDTAQAQLKQQLGGNSFLG